MHRVYKYTNSMLAITLLYCLKSIAGTAAGDGRTEGELNVYKPDSEAGI